MRSKRPLMVAWWMPVLAALAWPATAPAQAQANDDARPRGWLRILPVGDAPPFRQEIVNGVRRELEAPKGSLPPREVVLPVRNGKEDEPGTVQLRLGSISEPCLVSAGPLVLSGVDDGENAKPWAQFVMPERSAAMAVMFRDPRERTWDSVRTIVMGDDLGSFPVGAVRFANATPFAVNIAFRGKTTELKAGQVLVAPAGVLKDAQLAVAALDNRGRLKRIFDSAISQGAGERTNAIIHWSDGEDPRRPAKVILQRERPALKPIPKA